MQPFLIPDDFRAFMRAVVVYLESPADEKFLDAEDALKADCGYGGRIDGLDTYRFRYITPDGVTRWDVILREAQIHDIADGLLIEVDAEPFEIVRTRRRAPVGDPLLVWGPSIDDALHVGHGPELLEALDVLHATAVARPRLVRLWTAADDQLVCAMRDDCVALYVVESAEGYATSMGDSSLTGSFEVLDHEGHRLVVPLADCVSWDYARRALLRFITHGDLGDVPVEGRIPSLLLMFGDIDRATALAARPAVPRDLAHTSLMTASGASPFDLDGTQETTAPIDLRETRISLELMAWARRLFDVLQSSALIELAPRANLGWLARQLGPLLQAHATAAEHSPEVASWLADEIGSFRGVERMIATGPELQDALRRARRMA